MIWVDWCILSLALLSILLGALRGFFREVATVLVWAFAVIIAVQFGDWLAGSLQTYISVPSVRMAAAYAILFLGVLIAGAIITHFVVDMIRRSVISGTDRALGAVFGVGRALFLGGVLVLLAGRTPVRQDPWWSQSLTLPLLESVAEAIAAVTPASWIETLTPKPAVNSAKGA
jgi:membrane protein required for colicin V production